MATDSVIQFAMQYGPWGLIALLAFLLVKQLLDGGFKVEIKEFKAEFPKRK